MSTLRWISSFLYLLKPDSLKPIDGGERIQGAHSNRLHKTLHEHDIKGERSIALGQASICFFVLLLYLGAQFHVGWQSLNIWVIAALGGLISTSFLRAYMVNSNELNEHKLDVLNLVDISIFLVLIWSYQFAHNYPASGVLKSPSFALLFALVALRALRFHPRPIVTAGLAAAIGWNAIVLFSVLADGFSAVTSSYHEYLGSFGILIGAEIEKIIALVSITFFLSIAAFKARNILSKAAHVGDYSDALKAAHDNLAAAETARLKAEEALEKLAKRDNEISEQNKRYNTALDNMSQGLCMFDQDKNLLVCNDSYIEMYGLSKKLGKPGTPFRKIVEHRTKNGVYFGDEAENYIQERLEAVEEREPSTKIQELNNGRIIAITHRPTPGGGWVATHEDITELQRVQQQIEHITHHDALTDLANRKLLRNRIEQFLEDLHEGAGFSVLCLDLDRFKNVNDTLGHPIGDALLKAVAKRLLDCISDSDMVARLGGDEFAIVQKSDDQAQDATALAIRIFEELKAPFTLQGHQVVVDTSIGIAVAPADGMNSDQLIKNADLALYRAKSDGRGVFRFFEDEMDASMKKWRELELDLRKALETGQFELHYQPVLNLKTNEISGFEALLRWHHPDRGIVPPAEFIPIAEEIGLIVPIGEFVIREACAQIANWPDRMRVAVNLSPVQFKDGNLVPTVITAIASSGIAAHRLEFEITETVLLQDNDATLETLNQLQKLGVKIAMDDFGTGYSSLSYLRSFPFDKIKIDRSFISDLSRGEDAVAIIRAVASLGNSLSMITTAEGIETDAQLERVRAEGYTEIQDYLFSPPKPADEITAEFFGQEMTEKICA